MPTPIRTQWLNQRRRLWLLLGVLVFLAGVAVYQMGWRTPLLPVPVPADFARLDPQVRAHLKGLLQPIHEDPRNPDKWVALGIAYAANGLWEEARQTFLDVTLLAPQEPLARMYAAVALEEKSDVAAALREFKTLTEKFPNFAPGWYRVGESALRVGAVEEAESAFARLSALAPNEWRGPAGLGEILLRRSQAAAALPLLEQALRIDPEARPARFLLGQAFRAVGRTNEARLALARGAGVSRHPMPDPWSAEAPRHMKGLPDQLAQADELATAGRPELAVPLLLEALRFHPDHPGLIQQLAVALNRSGHPDQALPWLDRLIRDDPKSFQLRITRSYSQVLLRHPDQGLAEARAAVQLAPGTAQTHLAVANALLALERDAEAVAALETAVRTEPGNAEIHLELGQVLWRNTGDKTGAVAHFEQAIELSPALVKAYGSWGELQRELGNLDAARSAVETLRLLAPESIELRDLRQALRTP